MASCSSGEYEEWANPQSSAQEAAQTVSFTATAAPAIDFNNVTTEYVQLFVPTATSNNTITSQSLFATLSSSDGTVTKKIDATQDGKVKASDLQSAVEDLYGLAGDVRQIPTVITDTIKVNGVGYIRTANVTSTVNLVTPSYTELLYEMGAESGWSANHTLRSANFDGKYEGFYYLNGEFKFKVDANSWDPINYGFASEGKLADHGGNIPDPGAGFYQIKVDLGEGTYSLTKINYISITGDGVGGWPTDGDNNSHDKDMTYNVAEGCWEWTGTIAASKSFKIRMNHDWTISWGGKAGATDYDNMTYSNGNNLEVAEDGTYEVKFYLTYEGNNKVVITKK